MTAPLGLQIRGVSRTYPNGVLAGIDLFHLLDRVEDGDDDDIASVEIGP
jgi:hypothetical protein